MKKKDIIQACQLCINTYGGKHGKVKKILDHVEAWEIKNIEFYLGYKGNTGYIIFRGTDEWKDWAQNLETKSIDITNGQMHLGFYEDHTRIQKACFKFIRQWDKIIITGHSKGADQAEILHYFAKLNFPDKDIQCIAVAPAKCMSKHYKDDMKNIYTIINGEDYICKIPFWKFRHMGKVIRIGKRNFFFWIPFLRILGAWKYHPPIEYLKQMKKYSKIIP